MGLTQHGNLHGRENEIHTGYWL